MAPTQLHIAILDCDIPVPNVYAELGLYSDVFAAFLTDAAAKTTGLPELDLRFTKYDCIFGYLPSEKELLKIDAVLITGSAASAYDPAPWIVALTTFTKDLYTLRPEIRIFGSCFGHQILCNAIFSNSSAAVVERDPAGWELGIHSITLSPPFLNHFGPVTTNPSSPSQLRQQFVHADHVVLSPSQLQSQGFESIGRSEQCALQGVWKKGRVLTYQGHAEFDQFINGETLKAFTKSLWITGMLEETLRGVEGVDDAVWAAGVMLRFFLEKEVEVFEGLTVDGLAGERVRKVEVVYEEDVMARL